MNLQFEWQVGNNDGEWETLAKTGKRPGRSGPRGIPWWGWGLLVIVFATLGTTGYLIVRHRYKQARRQIQFQIQSVIDLEARTFAEGDLDLFLAQQDELSPDWYAYQKARIQTGCLQPQGRCPPVSSPEVQSVELQGEFAWVQVIEGQPPVRRVRFYRRTDLGWKHTAPRAEFWRIPVELTYGDLVFLFHRPDQPHIEPLIEHIYRTFDQVCTTLACTPDTRAPTIRFSAQPPVLGPTYEPGEGELTFLSPWLSGIPVDGTWDESSLDELAYWVAYATAYEFARSTPRDELNPVQTAIIDEFAAWHSQRDLAQAPIMGRVLDANGERVLRLVFRELRRTRTLSSFMERWLSISPTAQGIVYFETLLNIERDAVRAGRRGTFLLLQDESWLKLQASFFDQAQLDDRFLAQPAVQVESVEIDVALAHVRLKEQPVTVAGHLPQTLGHVAFFRLQNGDWKHASIMDMSFWNSKPTPTRTPSGNS